DRAAQALPLHALQRRLALERAQRPGELRVGEDVVGGDRRVGSHGFLLAKGASDSRSFRLAWWRCQRTVPSGISRISAISVLVKPSSSKSRTMMRCRWGSS